MAKRNFRWLDKVATAGSIRAAASELGVDPSSVSRNIQQLEEGLGVHLLKRKRGGAVVTEAGQFALEYYRLELERASKFNQQLERFRFNASQTLRVGIGQHHVEELVVRILHDLMVRMPDLRLTVLTGGTKELVRMALEEEVDFCVAYNPPSSRLLREVKSVAIPLVIVTAPNHPLTKVQKITLAEAAKYTVATPHKFFGIGQIIEQAAVSENVKFNHQFVTNSHDAVRHFVETGVAVTFSTEYAFETEAAAGRVAVLNIENKVLNSGKMKVLLKAGRPLSPLAHQAMRQVLSRMRLLNTPKSAPLEKSHRGS